ncbi:MAG: sulfur carrier protein ThiS [Opitutales bacterium]
MINIKANGKDYELAEALTIAKFIENCGYKPQRCVVEFNGRAMRLEEFADILLQEGDVLEIMSLVAGG